VSNGEIVGDILDRSPGFEKRDPLPQGSRCGTNDPNNPNCHHGSRSGKYYFTTLRDMSNEALVATD
jgi:hypothetical protein